MKIIGMIPARLSSKRVIKKNLRLLDGRPLISYVIETAKKSGVFDEIYINSEADIFGDIAEEYGIRFYKRPAELSSDRTINDEFTYDFVQNIDGDILVQILPTSPLITPKEMRDFVREMMTGKYDTLVSVVDHQIACVYKDQPINFKRAEPHKSSQDMVPVRSYATVLMAWTYAYYRKETKETGGAYHGGRGKTGYYPLKGFSTIDIDHEEDFALAEVALQYQKSIQNIPVQYYEPQKKTGEVVEVDVPKILRRDGVMQEDFDHENLPLSNLKEIIASKDNTKSWCHRVINTENNSATLISQLPGEGNRLHYHPNWNEWWVIVAGEWRWEIEGEEFIVKEGDIVFIEKNKAHCITAVGEKPAVRLAVSKDLVPHIYLQETKHDIRSAVES